MKNILISTIVRNRETFLNTWLRQIKELVLDNSDYNFYLSIYENDSTDKSKDVLNSLDYSFLKDYKLEMGTLNIPYFGSIKHDQRVQYLAQLRNRTLFNNTFLSECDYVISIEPDICYDYKLMKPIIVDDAYDILSARSTEVSNPDNFHLYDGWGTRYTESDGDWIHNIDFSKSDFLDVWSTYNCFCKYKSDLIKNKIAYGGFNERLKRFDCDTAVICENYRKNGSNKIGIYTKAIAFHSR